MDLGKFKANRFRLTMWILIPPLLTLGVGLSSYALRLESEWKLERTRVLADVLPKVAEARNESQELLAQLNTDERGNIKSEDEFISYLQQTAQKTGFTVNSLQVDRVNGGKNSNVPVLRALVSGTGQLGAIRLFVGDVSSRQQLLSETSLNVAQGGRGLEKNTCKANVVFELILFDQTGGKGL